MQSEQSDEENVEIVPLGNDENVPVENEANVAMETDIPQSPVATTPNTEMAKKSSNSSSKKKRRIKRLIDSDSEDRYYSNIFVEFIIPPQLKLGVYCFISVSLPVHPSDFFRSTKHFQIIL